MPQKSKKQRKYWDGIPKEDLPYDMMKIENVHDTKIAKYKLAAWADDPLAPVDQLPPREWYGVAISDHSSATMVVLIEGRIRISFYHLWEAGERGEAREKEDKQKQEAKI